ncbi:MAG: efflux RND transporter permease subunit [Desulfofustis sp.]|jgi:multidrug efflux pump subunit AcrB|nr:efflux RND transporter permease subunit [Desulfofustis sp.]
MIRWFAAHPTAANLLLLLLLAAGLFSAPALRRETFPDFRPTEIQIEIEYRGASAADVEDALCRRIDEAVRSVEYLEELICVAQDNLAVATATMEPNGDVIRFRNDIESEINALNDLPDRSEKPVIREMHRTDLVGSLAVSGNLPLSQLENYVLELEERLLTLPGVAAIRIRGLSNRQWQVEMERDVLAQYGLSARELAQRLSRQNIDMPLGILETAERDILLRFTDQRRSLADLETLVVVADHLGGELTLGEMATIREVGEHPEELVWFNGQRALVLEISKSLHGDSLQVMEDIKALRQAEEQRLHRLINLAITQDMTSIVRDRLQMLVKNGITGLILVLVVMSLFFRPRLALWAVLGLPAAFAGAFAVMAATGLSLNMITLVALLMAIGIVMDDSIVITDNSAAVAAGQASPLQGVVDGTRQVVPGVMSSFLTTAAVFVPLSFLAGEMGSVLEVLPVVLVAALVASLVEAFLILPHHLIASSSRSGKHRDSRFRAALEHRFARFREQVGRLADGAIRQRYAVLALVITVLLASVGFMAGGHIGREAMPEIDGDVLEARILMAQGTPLVRTEDVARHVETALRRLDQRYTPDQPNGVALAKAIQVRFNENASANEKGSHVATVSVDLLTAERRTITLEELSAAWRKEIGAVPGLLSLIISEPGFGPAGIPIEIRLQGQDLAALKRAAQDVAQHLAGYGGVTNVIDDLRLGKPQYRFSLSQGAYGLGLTAEEVAAQLRAALLGQITDTQRIGNWDIDILVRQLTAERSSLDDLAQQTIRLPDGRQIPLDMVVRSEETRDWARITRIDGRRTVTVRADVDARQANAQAIVKAMKADWLQGFRQNYPKISLSFEGQVTRSAETGRSIGRGLLIGLLGIFVILSFQFRSYLEPLIVMLSIPLAFMGAVWGHVLMGYYLSMPSLIGAASLAGIVVNNAILLIHFIKEHRLRGMTAQAAAGQASRDRLRAIIISTGTTIVGLLPILLETSTQATAVKPVVISVVFGLLVSTMLVLWVIPALYVLFDDWGMTRSLTAAETAPDQLEIR